MATSKYSAYYTSQAGGQIRVFRGGLQSGSGLGDVLRGVLRFIAPVALPALGNFASGLISNATAGMPLAQAAKAAIGPTLSAAASTAAPALSRFVNSVAPSLLPSSGRSAMSTTGPALSRYINSVVPGLLPPGRNILPTIIAMLGGAGGGDNTLGYDGDGTNQQGQGTVFQGIDGVPTSDKAVREYKRSANEPLKSIAPARKKRKPARGQSALAVHYNF